MVKDQDSFEKLEKYLAGAPYIVIPVGNVSQLRADQVPAFVDILDTLQVGSLEEKTVSEDESHILGQLPKSELRGIVLEYTEKKLGYTEIMADSRVPENSRHSVVSYLAHVGRGTYKKERTA